MPVTSAAMSYPAAMGYQSVPSYAPPPVMPAAMPAAMPAPAPPQAVTAGMPDPATVQKQKEGYMKMLDDQLQQSSTVLDQQMKYQTNFLAAQADQQKKQFAMQV